MATTEAVATAGDGADSTLFGPEKVLDFWFGGAYGDDEAITAATQKMFPVWFGIGLTPEQTAEFDQKCCVFIETIRALGRGELASPEWSTTDGLLAQIILTDQLARNCFRGTQEAFAYAPQAEAAFVKLVDTGAFKEFNNITYATFVCCVGQHSEDPALHALNKATIAPHLVATFGEQAEMLTHHIEDHLSLIHI